MNQDFSWGEGTNPQPIFIIPVMPGYETIGTPQGFQFRKLDQKPQYTHEEKVALFEAHMVCKELEEMFKG